MPGAFPGSHRLLGSLSFSRIVGAMRILSVLALLSSASLVAAEEASSPELPDAGEGYQHLERFIKVLESVRAQHPDADKLSYERLINHALEGMLGSLDPFSAFYHPETYAFIEEAQKEPVLPGLGLTLGKSGEALTVTAVQAGSAAARAGIARGDRLVSIGKQEVSSLSLQEVLTKLGGRAGDTVELGLRRASDRQEYDTTLLRAVVKSDPLPDAFLLAQRDAAEVGYVRLAEFSAPAHRTLEAALDDLEDKGMKALVLDLRGNPGGLLQSAVAILGEFLPPGTEVVFTKGRHPAHSSPPLATPERQRKKRDYPLVVLLDKNSASASELVAGALQDLERATIVGETSYGKGSVQSILPQPGGTALRLTIATYHTPSGRTPHEVGIRPDVEVPITPEDRDSLALWNRRESLTAEESATLEAWKDPVLAAALAALRP